MVDPNVPTTRPTGLGASGPAPSGPRTLWRGITRRCPRCGSGHLFHRYFNLVPDCPRCGMHFEREQGYFAGALAVNIVMVGGLFAMVFAAMLIFTAPDIPVIPILAIIIPIALIGPVVLYPFSKTIWMAVDRGYLQRLDPHERYDERPGGRDH